MKNTLLFTVGILLVAGMAYADEPAILNAPGNAWDNAKKVLSMAEPSGDAIWSMTGREFKAGSSIRLYSADGLKTPILNDLEARIGWFETVGLYGTLSIALDRATGKEILKYVHLGWMVGFDGDKDRDQLVTGPVIGAKLSF